MATHPAPIQLSPSVFLYQEDSGLKKAHQEDQNGPRLVILATWAFAQDNHIVKYIDKYRELYPNASIMVVKSFLRHFFWIPGARKELEPAGLAIRSLLSADDQTGTSTIGPPMLVHPRDRLPLHATVFDSSPGIYEYWSVANAVMFGVPHGKWFARIMAAPFAHLLSTTLWVGVYVFGGTDWAGIWGQAANNATRSVETCRSYVFSARGFRQQQACVACTI